MRLDPNIKLNQLVSCDSCYAIFSPDNIIQRTKAEKHICPKCDEALHDKQSTINKLNKQLDRNFENLFRKIMIEVTRITDVRLTRFEKTLNLTEGGRKNEKTKSMATPNTRK